MDRFTNAFEALLAALADAVKQLGEGSQQPWARTRVEEAKQDFVNCCDVMCFQLKQAIEMIKQEMLQHVPSQLVPQPPQLDAEQVRQVLDVAEQFAAQLRGPTGAAAAVASRSNPAQPAAAPHPSAVPPGTSYSAPAEMQAGVGVMPDTAAAAAAAPSAIGGAAFLGHPQAQAQPQLDAQGTVGYGTYRNDP